MRKKALLIIFTLLIGTVYGAGFKGELVAKDQKVTIDFRNTELVDVIRIISRNFDLNILAGDEIKGKVTVSLSDVPVDDALEMILKMNNYVYVKEGTIVRVMTLENAKKEYGPKAEVKQSADGKKLYKVFEIKNVKASAISEKIKGVIKSDGRVIVDDNSNKIVTFIEKDEIELVENIIRDIDIAGTAGAKKELPKSVETLIIPVRYTSGQAIETIVRDIYPEMDIQIKVNANAGLIVTGKSEDIAKIKDIAKQYDIQPIQISIEAKIVEITGKDAKTIGVNWEYSNTSSEDATLQVGSSGGTMMSDTTDGGSIKFGILGDDKFDVTLKALLNNTNSNLLSSPNITTLSGKPAVITVGDKIPYPVAAEEGQPVTYAFEEVGIKLEVTPIVMDNKVINMAVKPKVSNQNGTTPDNRPIVATRDADTNVIINDGETLVIGGLMRQNEVHNTNSIPILGDIPFLGALFKTKSTVKTNTNLIFFITPKIISGGNYIEKNSEPSKEKKGKLSEKDKLKLEYAKVKIREYEENKNYDKALMEIAELRDLGLADKETDDSYSRIKDKKDKK